MKEVVSLIRNDITGASFQDADLRKALATYAVLIIVLLVVVVGFLVFRNVQLIESNLRLIQNNFELIEKFHD